MRLEDPNVPFHPIGGPSIDAMVFLAPELLDSLRGDGLVALSRATDMYAVGCFAYEVRSADNYIPTAVTHPS